MNEGELKCSWFAFTFAVKESIQRIAATYYLSPHRLNWIILIDSWAVETFSCFVYFWNPWENNFLLKEYNFVWSVELYNSNLCIQW